MIMARVLICDDDPSICRLFETVLRRSGFEVVSTTSSADCLAICEEYAPDLALIDLILPGTDGVALTKGLRAKFPKLKILVVSCAGGDQLYDAWMMGANMVLRKPLIPALLTATVGYLTSQSMPVENPSFEQALVPSSLG
jgi:DNA-binding response OmpR family regulator